MIQEREKMLQKNINNGGNNDFYVAYEGVAGGVCRNYGGVLMGERLPEGSLLVKCLWDYNGYIMGDEVGSCIT